MTISTVYTRMNSSIATGQMAQMKWMMYLMPIMFLGFLIIIQLVYRIIIF